MKLSSARLVGLAAALTLVGVASAQQPHQHHFLPPGAERDLRPGDVMVGANPLPGPAGAPEIDPAALGSLASLLVGGGLLLQSRRRSRGNAETR